MQHHGVSGQRRHRGQPAWALVGLLMAWVGGRVIWWQPPSFEYGMISDHVPRVLRWASASSHIAPMPMGLHPPQLVPKMAGVNRFAPSLAARQTAGRLIETGLVRASGADADAPPAHRDDTADMTAPAAPQAMPGAGIDMAASAMTPPGATHGHKALRHWSADSWVMWRQGETAIGLPTYGASQTGAVLRYRLTPGAGVDDKAAPALYLRGYGALNGSSEKELAAGLQLRLLPRVPVVAMIEARASQFADGSTHPRGALMAVTQMPPVNLPLGMRAEVYAQGGYVAGRAATPFVDGQLRLDTPVDRLGGAQVRLGGGLWGGAQAGSGRLDIGPSLRVALPVGVVVTRLAVDWRMRVAGNAAPSSGPALTLSAGF